MSSEDARSALLILDVFSAFEFPGGDALHAQAQQVTGSLGALIARYRAAPRPVIYVNDHFGRWEDSFADLLARVTASGPKGAGMVRALAPEPGDYPLLKPRHSAFFETSLPSLLAHLEVRCLVVAGLAADACVLATVLDAHVRGFQSIVPVDTTAAQTSERAARVLAHLRESCGIATPFSEDVVP